MAQIYRQRKDIVTRSIAGETLLVPISDKLADMEVLFSLNEVGAFIWERLDGTGSLDSIQDRVLDEFDAEAKQVNQDLTALINDLLQAGLIEETA